MISLYRDPDGENLFKSSFNTPSNGISKHQRVNASSDHLEMGNYKENGGIVRERTAQVTDKISDLEVSLVAEVLISSREEGR